MNVQNNRRDLDSITHEKDRKTVCQIYEMLEILFAIQNVKRFIVLSAEKRLKYVGSY